MKNTFDEYHFLENGKRVKVASIQQMEDNDRIYSGPGTNDDMEALAGKFVTIACQSNISDNYYNIKEDDERWTWPAYFFINEPEFQIDESLFEI